MTTLASRRLTPRRELCRVPGMFHRWVVVASALACVFISSCKGCDNPPVVRKDQCIGVAGARADLPDVCTESTDCGDHYACREVKDTDGVKCCLYVDRLCAGDADCCPGQSCQTARNPPRCSDRATECTTDADCGEIGDRFCTDYSDPTSGMVKRCRHRPCGALGVCPESQSCFQGECIAALPCEGSCPTGEGCVPSAGSTGRCQAYAAPAGRPEAACPMTCNVGFIATFSDNTNIWDSCKLREVKCVCAELPGLKSNDVGRFSALASSPEGFVASMYDGQYGDLVVYRYDTTGTRTGIDYVDGVPAGSPTYGPSGARGGVTAAGTDVGRYTDIVTSQGRSYVSYYDVSNGDLKVAVREGATWSSHRVDGLTGDLGLYSSIDIDAEGLPGVAYFMRAGDSTFRVADCPAPAPTGPLGDLTALRFARSRVAVPRSEADWVIRTLACLSKPPPPCTGCGSPDVCADTGNGPVCLTAGSADGGTACGTTGDAGMARMCDANTEICVRENNALACGKKYNPSQLLDIPLGTGVFASLAFKGKAAIVAYQQRTGPVVAGRVVADGDLYAVGVDGQNVPGTPVLIASAGDVGYFPDVKIDPAGPIAIAFHDFTTKSLKYYASAQLQAGVALETIDNGVDPARPGEQSFVGTDTALVFGPQAGQVWAIYQDATRGDLKLARRTTVWAVQPSLATEGAVGFFADGVFANGRVWATHARLRSRLVNGQPALDNSLLLLQGPQN